jgi:50S ribosomal protein L16 3-hydroxylase
MSLTGMYDDPDLELQAHPTEISMQMVNKVEALLKAVTWQRQDVVRFLGAYLTEPKTHILFTPPRYLSFDKFCVRLANESICLGLTSRMLFHGDTVFINGESVRLEPTTHAFLRQLADARILPPCEVASDGLTRLLYQWYEAGYVVFRH